MKKHIRQLRPLRFENTLENSELLTVLRSSVCGNKTMCAHCSTFAEGFLRSKKKDPIVTSHLLSSPPTPPSPHPQVKW